jgi:predicted CXXCH cytochrome family protein
MSPGYDRPDHQGVTRTVHQECMFCHNAYPDAPAGGGGGLPHTYPAELPEGIGCQRCHGPGADHVRLALDSQTPDSMIRSAIVNPAKLSPRRRDDVCYQCHMLPSFAVPGVRRFGRGAYSFRPGEALADFRVLMDIREAGRRPGDRFEIDHQAYRLEQSRCFQASGGALSCLTCHDPHRKVPAADRAAHYRKVCLGCHDGDLASHPGVPGPRSGTGGAPGRRAVRESDCVRCHMPARRAQDVVHTVMTDHRIQRPPADLEGLLAPLRERATDLQDMVIAKADGAPTGRLAQVYRALAAIRLKVAVSDAVEYLEGNLDEVAPDAPEAWLALARGQIQLHRWARAETTLRRALALMPAAPPAAGDSLRLRIRENLALALAGEGERAAAEAVFRGLVTDDPEWPDTLAGLGRILLGEGRPDAAIPFLRRATDEGPNRAVAWDALGAAELTLHHPVEAAQAFRRALEVDPTRAPTYLRLAQVLLAQGRRDEALRYLRVGAATVQEPKELEARIESVVSGESGGQSGSRR